MLRHLEVINYGLIDEVTLDFGKGLTAITGETGSGKSILLGAFGLLLGERAESKSIKYPDRKCIVEAIFSVSGYGLESFFAARDLDFEEQTTVRREIAPGGKSRAFINDTPVSLATLKALGEKLVDIHSQHENSVLGERQFQFSVLDHLAHQDERTDQYRKKYTAYRKQGEELHQLKENEARMKQDLDYFRFQLDELSKINLHKTDPAALEEEQATLENAETIKSTLSTVSSGLDGTDENIVSSLLVLKSALQKISHLNTSLEEFNSRLDSVIIELREISRDLETYGETISVDPVRMEEVNSTLGVLYHLQQKHRLASIRELLVLKTELEERVQQYSSVDDSIARLEKELAESEKELNKLASEISAGRHKASAQIAKATSGYFNALHLEHAELLFELSPSAEFHSSGKDDIQLLFRANKGGQLLPIKQVASGGEISRVMLALKAVISQHKKLPVLILDEIDQGVSGEVGKKIGQILREMSSEMQLITITHLPQIAGQAQQHLKVFKETGGDVTTTRVSELTHEHRVREIAEMLSGKDITKAALENAKELMG